MSKIFKSVIILALFVIFAVQVGMVLAEHNDDEDKPVTGPITSPITSPIICKPGWGFGDKNHCHFGPPGQDKNKHDKDSDSHKNSPKHGNKD